MKISHIEPAIFESFARTVMEDFVESHPSEVDERDPNSPYREGLVNTARPNEQSRMNASSAPRREYAREEQKSAALRALVGLYSQKGARRFQEDLEERLGDREDKIPGSYYLAHEGLSHESPNATLKSLIKRKYRAKE